MLPIFHKVHIISRIAIIQRYGLYRRRQQTSTRPYLNLTLRDFHATPVTKAQVSEDAVVDVMQKLQDTPEAMVAITKFMQVAHKEGFQSLLSGRMPSKMELFRVFSNPAMRKAAQDMIDTFTNAGIEVDEATASKILRSLPEIEEGDTNKNSS